MTFSTRMAPNKSKINDAIRRRGPGSTLKIFVKENAEREKRSDGDAPMELHCLQKKTGHKAYLLIGGFSDLALCWNNLDKLFLNKTSSKTIPLQTTITFFFSFLSTSLALGFNAV